MIHVNLLTLFLSKLVTEWKKNVCRDSTDILVRLCRKIALFLYKALCKNDPKIVLLGLKMALIHPKFFLFQPNFNFAYRCLLPSDNSSCFSCSLSALFQKNQVNYITLVKAKFWGSFSVMIYLNLLASFLSELFTEWKK